MKKAKIMLMTIGVFAIVGGALAFKVKKIDGHNYCTTILAGSFCTVLSPNLKKVPTGGSQYYYTIIQSSTCPPDLECPTSTSFEIE